MDIVVKGRNVEVPDHFRQHVSEKLAPSERLDSRVIHLDVELSHEKNPRQSAKCQRVEITRAARARSSAPRPARRPSTPHWTPRSSSSRPACASRTTAGGCITVARRRRRWRRPPRRCRWSCPTRRSRCWNGWSGTRRRSTDDTVTLVVRDKTHNAVPMTTADALHEMELVGHDFYLFIDSRRGCRAWSTAATATTTGSSGWPPPDSADPWRGTLAPRRPAGCCHAAW